jgi:hypothetical protein
MELESPNVLWGDNQQIEASMLTPSSEDSDFPIENILDAVRSRIYKPTSNIFNITIDLGVNADIKLMTLHSPLADYFSISDAGSITLEGNNIDDFTTPPFSESVTIEETGAFLFINDATDSSYRYWKLSVDDNTNPKIISLGYFFLGGVTQLTSRTVSKGFSSGVKDETKTVKSMNGTLYFDKKQKYHVFNGLSLGYIPAADRRTLEKMYYDNGKSTVMPVSLDPNLKVSEEYGELTKLMYFENAPSVNHQFDDVYSVNFSMREVV